MPTEQWSILIFTSEVILVSITVGALLLVWIHRSRRQIRQLETHNQQLRRCTVKNFFERELGHTRGQLRDQLHDKQRLQQLLRLRRLWLEAEQTALVEDGNTASDQSLLLQAAGPLLVLTFESGSQSKIKVTEKPDPLQSFSAADRSRVPGQAREFVAAQKEIIAQLRNRYSSAADDNAQNFARVQETLRAADGAADAQRNCVENLAREFESARGSFKNASAELVRSQSRLNGDGDRTGEGVLIVSTDQPSAAPAANARAWLNELEQTQRGSMRELAAMREINSRQRRLILQLEKEIEDVKKNEDEYKSAKTLLDSLREQLRNYENCTVILEAESEQLRSRIETLNRIIEKAERTGSIDIIEQMQSEISHANHERDHYERQQRSLRHLLAIAQAKSVETASPSLLAWLRDFGLNCVAYIKGSGKQYWLSGDGSPIGSHIRQLLLSLVPTANQPWTQVKGGIVYVGASLHLFIYDTGLDIEEIQLNFETELGIINSLMQHLERGAQQVQIGQQQRAILENLRQQYARIETQQRYLSDENQRIGEKLQQEIEQYFESITLTPLQRSCIDGCFSDFKTQLALLSQAARGVHNQLRMIGKSLAEQTPNAEEVVTPRNQRSR